MGSKLAGAAGIITSHPPGIVFTLNLQLNSGFSGKYLGTVVNVISI